MGLRKGQKQGRDERAQEDYPTSAVYFLHMSSSVLAFLHLCLVSVLFSGLFLTEKVAVKLHFYSDLFPLVYNVGIRQV